MSRLIRNYQPNPRNDDPLCLACEHNEYVNGIDKCAKQVANHPEVYRCIKFERRIQNGRSIR
jgi:hypothetical protein